MGYSAIADVCRVVAKGLRAAHVDNGRNAMLRYRCLR